MLIFDWDSANRAHLARHGITPEEAEQALTNNPVDVGVQSDDEDGERFEQIGETNNGRILLIVTVWRGEATRVVTGWDATKAFKDFYLECKARQTWQND